jgi:hypothetical protein
VRLSDDTLDNNNVGVDNDALVNDDARVVDDNCSTAR